MDLRQLNTFAAIVEHGTVSKAALRLHTAQPALSRQIGALEQELGVKLFDRIRRRLVLTAEGEQLLGDCRAVLRSVGSLGQRAEELRRGEGGLLKVAATPQMIDGVFSSFLPRFAELAPKVEVRLTEAIGEDLLAMLERGELHLGISSSQALRDHKHLFGSFNLPALQFIACCHKGVRLAKGRAVEIERLAAHRLLLLDPSFVVRTIFDAGCRLAGIEPRVGVESRAPHTLLALAEVGYGVAVISSVLPTHRYALNIFRITHEGRPLQMPMAILWDKRRTLPTYAGLFCDAFDRYAREVFPNRIERKGGETASGGSARRSGSVEVAAVRRAKSHRAAKNAG
jgi:DNA-binding transcriptional LysR family regulator